MSKYWEMTTSGELRPLVQPEGLEESEWLRGLGFDDDVGWSLRADELAEDIIGDREVLVGLLIASRNVPETTGTYEFLAEWHDGEEGMEAARIYILARNLIALMQLRRFVAPIVQALVTKQYLSELTRIAQKAFRVSHGHDSDDCCVRCAP